MRSSLATIAWAMALGAAGTLIVISVLKLLKDRGIFASFDNAVLKGYTTN